MRGGVIDVFPPGAEEPVRLDLFGDTLESIRGFDRETQPLHPPAHLRRSIAGGARRLLDEKAIHTFRQGYLAAFGAPGEDPLYATVSEGGRRAGMEHWLPLFYDRLETLFDYLPKDAPIGVDKPRHRGSQRTPRPDRRRLRRAGNHRAQDALSRPAARSAVPHRRGVGRPARRTAIPALQPLPGRTGTAHSRSRREAWPGVRLRARAGQRQPVRGHRRPCPRPRQGWKAGDLRLMVRGVVRSPRC